MNKYDSDSYNLTLFNERGAKIEKKALGNVGLVMAQYVGRQLVAEGDAHSFVIERVLFNSMDRAEAWLPKPTGRFSDGKPYRQED